MKDREPTIRSGKSIQRQIMLTLLGISALFVMMLAILSFYNITTTRQYTDALRCANTATDFHKEFKSTIDSEMYNHVIRPRTENSVAELPMDELDNAQTVLLRLESETSIPDNRWRARSMLDMCSNLRAYMIEIAGTDSYDERMLLLERNIRGETGLTSLIETYMHDFLDEEVRELARLQREISSQSNLGVAALIIVSVILAVLIILFSVRMSRRITEPIGALSHKARMFGKGVLVSKPVETDIVELQTLDRNFDKMAGRINTLMERQIENQRSLHRAELELLQAQINPHFLYNTLDSIAILAESNRGDDVIDMVNSLSTFFRNSLSQGKDIISLKTELAQAKSYLEIQQIRYSDILSYDIDIPEDLQDSMVPKLLIQPLIENALYHGIKNRRGRGHILISGEKRDGMLLIRVTDNGVGMTPEQLTQLQSGLYHDNHTGLGLKNVHQRIRLYCGEPYGLFFESEIDSGTTVTAMLPQNGITEAEEVKE